VSLPRVLGETGNNPLCHAASRSNLAAGSSSGPV